MNWTSANPRPVPADDSPPIPAAGRVTILATAIGEESFTDTNGSGFYVTGDPFDNIGEPYRDDNENHQYDLGEYFLDFLHTGVYAGPDGTFHGITCTGSTPTSTCTTNTWPIGVSATLIMSTDAAVITIISGAGPYAVNGNNAIAFNVKDTNGNPMPSGTTITVTASAALGTITEGSFTVACDIALGGEDYTSFLTGASTAGVGNVSITVTSPDGTVTTLNDSTSVQ